MRFVVERARARDASKHFYSRPIPFLLSGIYIGILGDVAHVSCYRLYKFPQFCGLNFRCGFYISLRRQSRLHITRKDGKNIYFVRVVAIASLVRRMHRCMAEITIEFVFHHNVLIVFLLEKNFILSILGYQIDIQFL